MGEKTIKDIITRLDKLEQVVFGQNSTTSTSLEKTMTLPEIIRGKKLKSGQEKIAVIVGYYEKIAHKSSVKESDLKEGWRIGKFDGNIAQVF